MYGQCLLTPTILDSYEFLKNAPYTWKERAEVGFLAKLRREHVDYPAWVSKGQAFEDAVVKVCNAHNNSEPITVGSEHFQTVCNKVYNGKFQQKLMKKVDLDGEKVFFFGFCDVLFPKRKLIIDIKTTLNYKGPSKYLSGHQHLVYTHLTEIPEFEYLIAQWESEDSNTIQAVHSVEYKVDNFENLQKELYDKVLEFFTYLRDNNLWLDYYHTFSKN